MEEDGEREEDGTRRVPATTGDRRNAPPEAEPVLHEVPEPEEAENLRPAPIPLEPRREMDMEEPRVSRVLELEQRLGRELEDRQDRELEEGTERRLESEVDRAVEGRVKSELELEIETEIGRQLGPPTAPKVVDLSGGEPVPFARVLSPAAKRPSKRLALKNRQGPTGAAPGREAAMNGRPLGQTPGHGLRNRRGLSNGAINGEGIVNGLRGRAWLSNGAVNGRGAVNGLRLRRGLSNGNGLSNGDGMVNGRPSGAGAGRGGLTGRRGRQNGELVDAEGAVNGRGMVNGRGIINGEDLISGRAQGVGDVPPRPRRATGTAIMVIVVVFLLAVATIYFAFISTEKGVHVDGVFSDWSGVPRTADDIADTADPNINMVSLAMVADGSSVSFYVKFEGKALAGAGGGVDSVYAFFDTDQDTATGYRIDSVGAESVLIIDGYDGRVSAAGLYRFSGDGGRPANDWNSRTPTGACRAAAAGTELEAQAGASDLGLSQGGRLNLFVLSSNGKGGTDQAAVMSNEKVSLAASWSRTGPDSVAPGATGVQLLRLDLSASGGTASLSSLTLRADGALADGDLSRLGLETAAGFVVPGASGTLSGGVLALSLSPPVPVVPGTATTLFAVADVSGGAPTGRAVGLGLDGSRDIGADTRAVTVETGALPLTYIGAPSARIVIDGAFSDWESYPEHTDPAGDVGDPDIDVLGFRTASDAAYLYVSLRVDGRMMGGSGVPEKKLRPPAPPGQGGGGPAVLPVLVGADSAFVFVDTDNDPGTGYTGGWLPVGAEYMANCTGQYGRIGQKVLHRFAGAGRADWSWAPAGDIDARTDEHRLEAGLPLASLGSPAGNLSLYYYTTDWRHERDSGDALVFDLSAGSGGRGAAPSAGPDEPSGRPVSGRDIQPLHAPEFRDALVPLAGMTLLVIALRRRRRAGRDGRRGGRMDY